MPASESSFVATTRLPSEGPGAKRLGPTLPNGALGPPLAFGAICVLATSCNQATRAG